MPTAIRNSYTYRPSRPPLLATLREFLSLFVRDERAPQTSVVPPFQPRGAVLVLPALLRGDRQTRALRAALASHGYAAFGWELGVDFGPTPKLMAGVEARLIALSDSHGPISLIGLSMGGLFCRWLAFRHPDRVRQVITVCSPFRSALDSFWLPLHPAMKFWRMPGLAAMAEQLEQPLPVPGACLYSRHDGIVAWESCLDPQSPQDCFAIEGSHVTIAADPSVRAIILEQLGRLWS